MTVATLLATPTGHTFAGLATLLFAVLWLLAFAALVGMWRQQQEMEAHDLHSYAMRRYGGMDEYAAVTRVGVYLFGVWKVVQVQRVTS